MPYVKEEKEQTIKAEQKDLKQISAFEGVQAFQKYVDKVQEKNYSNIRHLQSGGKKMSTLIWEMGLRDGYYPPKPKEQKEKV